MDGHNSTLNLDNHSSTVTPTIAPDQLPDPLLIEFEHRANHLITEAYSSETQETAHIVLLSKGLEELSQKAIEIGDLAFAHLSSKDPDRFEDCLITFDWSERTKYFLLLWRDILFEEQKTFLRVSDGDVTLEAFQEQKMKSRDLLFELSNDLKNYLESTKRATLDHKKVRDVWYLQTNPWPIYKEQFSRFQGQAKDLNKQFEALWNSSGAYVVINSHFIDSFNNYLDTIKQVKAEINAIRIDIKDKGDDPISMEVVQKLEAVDRKVLISNKLGKFNSDLNEQIEELPKKMKVNVSLKDGCLLYKDLNVRQSTREWLESEVMSEVYEFFQISNNIHSRLNLAIENIRNLIQNERLEGQPHPTDDIQKILQNLTKNLDKSSETIVSLRQTVKGQLGKTLGVSKVFQEDFLSLSFQSTINQYRRYQIEWWEKLKGWCIKKGYFIKQYRKSIREEEVMSVSEKIVRVVRARTVQADNLHYTNIFMTQGYIGSSFWVGRTDELNHISTQIENWRQGFRGALLLTGKRFSGKTLLGQLVNKNHFEDKAVLLKPENRITIQGRTFETTMNLGESLDFVLKYIQEPTMIWIDDLELWQDDKITLSQNIRFLIRAIDQNAGRIFFTVSTSNWLYDQLKQWFEIEKIFQTEINLDRMSWEEIKKAVLIRHSATHMQLVNKESEEFNSKELDKLVSRFCRLSEGNVGQVMHHWAAIMHKYNDEKVQPHSENTYTLPDFLNPDIAVLLRSIMIERRTNEYRLRKYLGPSFKTIYRPILQRAMNLGVVNRNLNGWLEINPMIVNEVGRLLDKQGYLKFDGRKGYTNKSII